VTDVVVDLGMDQRRGVASVAERSDQFAHVLAGPQSRDDLADTIRGEAREGHVVDQRGRLLVRHADAGSRVEPDGAVGRGGTETGAHRLLERRGHLESPRELGHGARVQVDGDVAAVFAREEVVEGRRALDLYAGEIEVLGQEGDGVVGDAPEGRLHLPQHREELSPFAVVLLDDGPDGAAHGVDGTSVRAPLHGSRRHDIHMCRSPPTGECRDAAMPGMS
jgi:hypothetical protein